MTVKTKKAHILSVLDREKPAFLKGLRPAEVEDIVSRAVLRRFPPKHTIFNEASGATHLYLMLDGSARGYAMTSQGGQIGLGRFPAGRILGWATLTQEPMDYIVSAAAVTRCVALEWDRATVQTLRVTYPRLLENAMRIAYDYVAHYRRLHLAALCDTVEQRLARVLNELAKDTGRTVAEGIELHISNEELASEAHATIFTVSRLMREWRRKGVVKKYRGRVVVLLPEALMTLGAAADTATDILI